MDWTIYWFMLPVCIAIAGVAAMGLVELYDHGPVRPGLAYLHDPARQRSSRLGRDEGKAFLASQEDGTSRYLRCGRNCERAQA